MKAAAWAILLSFSAAAVLAAEIPVYVNTLSLEADQAMRKIAGQNPAKLTEAELIDWARARLAWVSLRRLQGREKEALAIFGGCGIFCEKFGPEKDWAAARAWGCQKNKGAKLTICRSSAKKTKAQKPSR